MLESGLSMEYCPYCQRWVEPKKGTSDVVVGGLVGGLRGALVGAAHYFYKGARCPICNNVIKGRGARNYIPPMTQVPPIPQQPMLASPIPSELASPVGRSPSSPEPGLLEPRRAALPPMGHKLTLPERRRCVRCGTPNSPSSGFCIACGAPSLVVLPGRPCVKCNKPILLRASFCSYCGARQP